MMNEVEQRELRKILDFISDDDLLSLATTCSSRLVRFTSKEDAVEAIFAFSPNVEDILRRQKMKRYVLFLYLVSQRISVSESTEKSKLVEQIVRLWGGELKKDDRPVFTINPGVQSIAPLNNQPPDVTDVALRGSGDHGSDKNIKNRNENTNDTSSTNQGQGQIIAEQFVKWFYHRWNALHPDFQDKTDDFQMHHFWNDCTLKIYTPDEESFLGCEVVHRRFVELVMYERLAFSANEINGVRGLINAHGLVLITVCGSVHQMNTCVGLFQQKFGLIRDPLMENNFRIKFSELKILKKEDPLSLE